MLKNIKKTLGLVSASCLLLALNANALSKPPIAEGNAKFLGNVYAGAQVQDFADYWNQVTPENAGKWGSVERTRDVMNWNELDKAYALAVNNDIPFKLHVLIWGNQQPGWMDTLPKDEQLAEIEEWFAALANRYSDIDFIEVVNEPLNAPPNGENPRFSSSPAANYSEALGGDGTTGYDWIIKSFELARHYFPDSNLLINEYGIINETNLTKEYVKIVNLLKERDLIDSVGFQAHAFSTTGASSNLKNNLDLLAATGLDIYVTELDIDGTDDAVQLASYKRLFPIFWDHSAVKGITLWGWRPGLWRDAEGAYLIDKSGNERPALLWLKSYINDDIPTINADQMFTIKEDAAALASVGQLSFTDTTNVITGFTINNNTSPFVIDDEGNITLSSTGSLDYESTSSYTLSVSATGDFGSTLAVTVTVNIIDITEAVTPEVEPESSSSSGGSMPWSLLLSLFLTRLVITKRKA
ncbi:endo-1,4-beta-xylanase [Psychrosphaera algicola]|uniref:endo-1,4-beta-xylanase n=1 Tax=Psychrosphaera algicola TaxID=3023714 RepID=A0ABT5FIL4_9GAMM|nr:endo-1,4-beta-xylanase [Psychrosphaera sp. G1-22]MDC2891045.1 endo-1,4-beta-xylanase [Psychrosphaera sp. G1-22]